MVAAALVTVGLVPASYVGWEALGKRASVRTGTGEGIEGLTMGSDVRFTNWSLAYSLCLRLGRLFRLLCLILARATIAGTILAIR